jgi:aspartate racemase
MKFGIIGGIGPVSTVDYYNGIIANCLNAGKSYPELVINSIDMNRMCSYFEKEDYNNVLSVIVSALYNLKEAGADYAAIASNTPHIIFDEIKKYSPLPLVSIVEQTCKYIADKGYKKVLFLGTAFTMKSGLYAKSLKKFGIATIIPRPDDIETIHGLIFPNLENGIVIAEDKAKMIAVSEKYIKEFNIEAVILGCTEIPLMIKEGDMSVPVINTTQIHIDAISALLTNEKDSTEFDSVYCNVKYLENKNAVLLTWKKFACFENYRKPTSFALELMKKYPVSSFIIDARNGFEDEKADAQWGFSWLLPEMSRTDCKTVTFVMNEVQDDIEEEMDMWTAEFSKYFKVVKTDNFKEA